MTKWIHLAVSLVLVGGLAFVGYRFASKRVETDIYRSRLLSLADEYESLRGQYNEAVRKTAVTELLVEDGKLSVAIRTMEGVDRLIETPYDPTREIYCDYVLVDGRLWIRRVYDADTPPNEGLLIDSAFAEVDWEGPTARHGNAVYRSLGEGRWVVTVTGDGSLGLTRTDDGKDIALSPPPPVRDYDEIRKQIDGDLEKVSLADVLERAIPSRD